MQRLLRGSLIVFALALALPAAAQVEHPPVPVEKAAYHWPVFSNEHVMVLRVYFPPGRGSNYHIHSLDQISVQVEAGANAGQVWGEAPTPARPGTKRSGEFHGLFEKDIHPQVNQHGGDALPEHRHRAPEAKAGGSCAGGASETAIRRCSTTSGPAAGSSRSSRANQ